MDIESFAGQWIADWNSHDIERVLDHYTDDAEFRSPNAVKMVGQGVIRGRAALKDYWGPALQKRPELRFYLKQAFIGYRTISIHYGDELGRDVVETLVLNDSGKATFGCGCYA
ncbi:nuclear transport factor 2 family protein [Novosphingobium sp. G106]|uniref:YybH family protein n=1 Tax=Novosphingobium sp. G106 TaxID=2849500 RepID=UPI001C2DA4DE|nr:nuclear transport factor 2 family protein [Novosphingobium sp. G106]MBV1688547.1 nuclear transport factor 2 family protein [Novosphingobium sp. G106]